MWDYRILKDENRGLRIIEIYFEDKKITGWCESEVSGNNLKEIASDLGAMVEALGKPILTMEDLPPDSDGEDPETPVV